MRIFGRRSSSGSARRNSLGRAGLALFLLVAVLPILFSLGYALAYSVGATGLLSRGWTAEHWRTLVDRGEIWASFGLSLYVAALTVALTVGCALTCAVALRRPLTAGPLSYLVYLPLALPATVAAFLVFQLFSGGGTLTRVLLAVGWIDGIEDAPAIVNDRLALGIVLAHVTLAAPFFMLLFVQIYDAEKVGALTRVAQTLGASRRAALLRVTVPILFRKAFTNVALLFIAVLGSYEIPLLLGRQTPQMVSVLTMRKYALFDITEKPQAFVVAMLYTLLVLALIGLAFRKGGQAYDR